MVGHLKKRKHTATPTMDTGIVGVEMETEIV